MSPLPQKLLSAALHVKWDHGRSEDATAVELITARVSGVSPEECAEASRLAAALDQAAYALADAWHATRGAGPWPSAAELEAAHPGFAWDDYLEAVHKNILWARK